MIRVLIPALFMTTTYGCKTKQAASETSGVVFPYGKWSTTNLNVCFEKANEETKEVNAYIRKVVEDNFHNFTKLRFQGWKQCNESSDEMVKVAIFSDVNKVQSSRTGQLKFTTPSTTTRSIVKGKMSHALVKFNLGMQEALCKESGSPSNICLTNSILHEFGHVVGLEHEHDHDDSLCDMPKSKIRGLKSVGKYDASSIMNYCNVFWGQAELELSNGDVSTIKYLYEKM